MRAPTVVLLAAVVLLAGCAGSPTGGEGPDAAADPATDGSPAGTTASEAEGATGTDGGAANAAPADSTDSATARSDESASDRSAAGEASGETTGARPSELVVTVEAAANADTFVVSYENDSLDRVRLAGADAPPLHRPADPTKYEGVPHNRDGERCLGAVASGGHGMVTARLEGETVRVVLPEAGPTRDPAGRLLGHLVHDGVRLDRLLVRDGFARVPDRAFRNRADHLALQTSARANRAGVWKCSALDWQFGSDTPLSIERVDPETEHVVISNTGGQSVDLTGWSMYDADDDLDYDFPDGFGLSPGQSVVLHTGDGTDRRGHLYWGLNREAWDDDGDVVYVRRSDGSVAVRYEYENYTGM